MDVVFGTGGQADDALRRLATQEASRKARRGGFHPKPRQGEIYCRNPTGMAALPRKDEWEHDTSKSVWNKFFHDQDLVDSEDDEDDQFLDHSYRETQFREEFHVPRRVFFYHLRLLHRSGEFDEKTEADGQRGRRSHPLHLKLAFSFVKLTEGISFKRGETLSCISAPVLRKFHHHLLKYWRRMEFKKHVYLPRTAAEVREVEAKYAKMGFPGACVSYDGVPIPYPKCPAGATGQHKGKEGYPTRRFLVGVDSDGAILSMGNGSHPGTRNDLTMASLDPFLTTLRDGNFFPEVTFKLEDEHGQMVTRSHLYAIVDNGFHKWRCCQPPDKVTSDSWRLRWSKRLESVRKDSECCFGRMKARFAAARHGPPTSDLEHFDDTIFACAMLHNQLLRHDGLSNPRISARYWKPANTDLDLQRIEAEHSSGQGYEHPVNNAAAGNITEPELQSEYLELQSQLVTHFKQQWQKEALLWPKKKHYFSTVNHLPHHCE
jgi:hypothetical protein